MKNIADGISSPNPNYEQPVKCVTGENTVRVKSPQLIDFASKTDTGYSFENDTLVYESSKRAYAGVQWDISESIKNNQGKKLYFSYESINVSNQVGSIAFLRLSFSDGTAASYNTLLNHNLEHISYTIPNDTSNINKAFFAIYSNNSSNNTDDYSVTIVKPQLQFGETALPYSEYGTPQEKELDLEGYNKINYDNNTNVEKYGYNANGNKISTLDYYINQKNENIKPSTAYYLSFKQKVGTPNVRFCEYKKDGTFIQRTSITSKQTITTDSNTDYVIVSTEKTSSAYFEELQLSEGSTEKPYEAYWKLEVYENGYFSRENGKWYLNNEYINLSDYTNLMSFITSISGINRWGISVPNCKTAHVGSNSAYSTHFKLIAAGQTYNQIEGFHITNLNGTNTLFIYADEMKSLTRNEAIEYLNNRNVKFILPLITPSKTEIPNQTLINQLEEIYKLMSYDGTTIIETECENGNMPIIISASALLDSAKVIEDLETRIETLESEE